MNYLLTALVGFCLCLAHLVQAERQSEKPGFYYEQRPRLGHFKLEPFRDLYKTYAAAFVQPNFEGRQNDDYKNYLPSGDECIQFFKKFRIDELKLRDLDEVVMLDACLGYLYESEYHEIDSEASKNVADNLPAYLSEPHLRVIYDNTSIDTFPKEAKECIGTLLFDVIRVKRQFSEGLCNKHWLDVFNNFAACHSTIPNEPSKNDSYLKMIYELTRIRGNECFENEIRALNKAVRDEYTPLQDIGNSVSFFGKFRSQKRKQLKDRLWAKPVANLLRAIQGHPKGINLREISQIVRGVSNQDLPNHEIEKQKLLENMAKHSDLVIKPKDNKATKADPSGVNRYNHMVDKLCNFFRASDSEKTRDFTTPFKNMVRMLNYPEIFNISNEQFIKKVFTHSWESAPLYMCVSSCNILTFTEAAFVRTPHNSKYHYKVVFKPDTTAMVRWPSAGYD